MESGDPILTTAAKEGELGGEIDGLDSVEAVDTDGATAETSLCLFASVGFGVNGGGGWR